MYLITLFTHLVNKVYSSEPQTTNTIPRYSVEFRFIFIEASKYYQK